MKKTKVILTLVCAVLLVAASVMGTLAWLTTTASVTNTFTVGNVEFGGDDGEAGLDEALVNEKGQPIDNDTDKNVVEDKANAPRVTQNSYKMVPGHTYTKDPTIHVKSDSEDCYVFVTIENQIAELETNDSTKTIAAQMAAKGWVAVSGQTNVYAWHGVDSEGNANSDLAVVKGGGDVVVFDEFTLDTNADVNAKIDNGETYKWANKTIVVKAYGIQVDGLTDKTDADVWAAFGTDSADTAA